MHSTKLVCIPLRINTITGVKSTKACGNIHSNIIVQVQCYSTVYNMKIHEFVHQSSDTTLRIVKWNRKMKKMLTNWKRIFNTNQRE